MGLRIHPIVFQSISDEGSHLWREGGVGIDYKVLGLAEGKGHGSLSYRSEKVIPLKLIQVQETSLGIEIIPEHWKRFLKGCNKGVESLTGNAGCVAGSVQRILPASSLFQHQCCTLHSVKGCCQGNLMVSKDLHFPFVGLLPFLPVTAHGHAPKLGESLVSIGNRGGYRLLKPSPG